MNNWFQNIASNLSDVIKYGSVANKEMTLKEEERQQKAQQEAEKRMNSEQEKANKQAALEEGKIYDYFQKLKKEELDKIKIDKEKVNLFEKIKKLFDNDTQPVEATDKIAETPKTETTPTPTPTLIEKAKNFANALGLGTTFATEGKPNLPDRLVPYVNESAEREGIDPIILAAQLAQETGGFGYTPRVGTSGEQGISQIIPKFHYKSAGVGDSNSYAQRLAGDDSYSVSEQARILGQYLKGQGNIYDALRQYNAGGNLTAGTNYATEILKRAGLDNLIGGTNVEDLSL